MKKVIILILIGFFLQITGCFGDDGTENNYYKQLNASNKQWEILRDLNNGTYKYQRSIMSWVGWKGTAVITLENNQVVSRDYLSKFEGEIEEQWTEEESEIGTHDCWADPVSIEQLYNICREEVLNQNEEENDITLEFFDNGVLQSCTYYPHGCADDCTIGVTIDSIEF